MKKTKIIIPALGLLLLSTAASVTGTVAWFSSINSVTASSMVIKAKVGANLYIKEGASVLLDDLVGASATLSADNETVSPCDMTFSTDTVTAKYPLTYGTNPTAGTAGSGATWQNVGTFTATTATDNSDPALDLDLFCVYSYVTIARKQTTAATYDLAPTCTVSCSAASNLNKALRAGILMNNTWIESEDKNSDGASNIAFTFNSTKIMSLADNTAYSACLLLWFEGEDSDCFTNNAITLSVNTASWSFEATDHQA